MRIDPPTLDSIQARHDRALVGELENYLKERPDAADRDRVYLKIFETAVEHDWFAEHESLASVYLTAEPGGAVAPMARIVTIMARAQAGDFGAAREGFRLLMRTLDEERPIAFAADFARTLAGEAIAAGRVETAREVYGDLIERFGSDPDLRADVARWQGRLDLVRSTSRNFGCGICRTPHSRSPSFVGVMSCSISGRRGARRVCRIGRRFGRPTTRITPQALK